LHQEKAENSRSIPVDLRFERRSQPQGVVNIVSSAEVSQKNGLSHAGGNGTKPLTVALIGPDEERRSAMATALGETRHAVVREFDSYPPEFEHLQRLLASFDILVLDIDSDPDAALELVRAANARNAATIMVYSLNADPRVAVRFMRAGAREYMLLPLEQGAASEALARTAKTLHEKARPSDGGPGKLLVFTGSKGGSGVTTVSCNVAIALAQRSEQKTLLIDLALPIGDAALCLGIAAGHSTEDALRSIDRLDANLLQTFLVQHRSGIFVLSAPTSVPEVEVSKEAIDKLIAIARREFDHVIVDVGSRIDVAAKVLFEQASTIYLVIQTGISELRNSNRLISQFFTEGSPNLEVVINRYDSRFHETVNEDVIAKALGKAVRWKLPNDQDAARALQSGENGFTESHISRISLEMANSITGHATAMEKTGDLEARNSGRGFLQVDSTSSHDEKPDPVKLAFMEAGAPPAITWPAPNPISYGVRLSSAQLNATASADGTLTYTPGPGYVLPVGTHTLWVTFTPADSGRCAPLQAAISIAVTKATPTISWPKPGTMIFGAALDAAQLNASAAVAGQFDYSPASGEVLPPGRHTLSVTFTPADGTSYATAQTTVQLVVAKAACAIQWPTPESITYGTQLSDMQLCAVAPIPGTFEYNPGSGAVLAAGEHRLSVVFNPTDTMAYSESHSSVSLKVGKAAPTVTWAAPEPIAQGAALSAAQINAMATVPGSFAYRPKAGEILAPGVHELSVTFTPTDTLNYTAVRAAVSLTVAEKTPAIITWPTPSAIPYGTALSIAQMNATASVPGIFVYTPSAGHVLAPGKYNLSASFTPSDTEKYATAQAAVLLEVQGSPDMTPLPSAAPETQSARGFKATYSSHEDPAPVEVTDESTANMANGRETRSYKGAVYEKGEDGQWHLQKN
jgi:Flp pilus assembly CpaE family ATPase